MKDKIKPIYSELQGYLSQAPAADKVVYVYDSSLWEQFNATIEELNDVAGTDYSKFKVTNIRRGSTSTSTYILNSDYRSKLNGLIMRLHGEFFSNETSPFSGSPSTIVHQSQSQTAQAQVVMLLDLQNLINEKLNEPLEANEKGFLESVKSKLAGIKNVAEVIQLLISTAKVFGLTFDQLTRLFS